MEILKQNANILVAVIFLPVFVFYLVILMFAVNIPYWDDYDVILDFMNKFTEAHPLARAALVFSQHNEHRVAFARLSALTAYYLTGRINFKLLTIAGSLGLMGLAVLLQRATHNFTHKFLYSVPVVFFLFQPQYWGSICFASPALSGLAALFFSFLALYLLTREGARYFMLSLLFTITAAFTSGNGLLVFGAGFAPLLVKRRYKEAVIWALAGLICASFYFYGYVVPSHHSRAVEAFFSWPIRMVLYYLGLLGLSFADLAHLNPKTNALPFAAGAFFSLYFIWLAQKRYYQRNLANFSWIAFLLITSAATAIFRSGFGMYFPSRYKIISVLVLIVFYISLIDTLSLKSLKALFPFLLAFSVIFNVFLYKANFDYMILQRKYLREGLAGWNNGAEGLAYPDAGRAGLILNTAIAKKFYSYDGERSLW